MVYLDKKILNKQEKTTCLCFKCKKQHTCVMSLVVISLFPEISSQRGFELRLVGKNQDGSTYTRPLWRSNDFGNLRYDENTGCAVVETSDGQAVSYNLAYLSHCLDAVAC